MLGADASTPPTPPSLPSPVAAGGMGPMAAAAGTALDGLDGQEDGLEATAAPDASWAEAAAWDEYKNNRGQ